MKTWRAVFRTLAILISTLIAFAAVLGMRALGWIAPQLALRGRNATFRRWGRALCRAFGARIRVEGTPPTGRFVLVTNHLSYVDIPLLGSLVDAAFIGKADLRGWPLLGAVFDAADTIFIDRSRKRDLVRVMGQVDAAMDRGLGLVFFPEGTSGKGDRILPLKGSLLQIAVTAELPVHWATITYGTVDGDPPPSHGVCWWGDEPLLPHYRRLSRLESFDATIRFGEAPIAGTDRKALAEALRSAMESRFEPME
ncbi:MAG: lysophospholipid acyltransferase family protein [Acidobacteriota bacterium]